MTQWEYLARTFVADKEHEVVIDYLQRNYPETSWKELPKHDALVLEAWLAEWGRHGWELVTCELAESLGRNGDLGSTYSGVTSWRKVFFCVFKRPVEKEDGR